MNPAPLPGRLQGLGRGRLDAFVAVRDHQLDATQAAPGQAAQEAGPEHLGLGEADRHAQHFAPAIGVDRHSDYYRHRDDVPGLPHLEIGGIQPEVRPFSLDRAVEEGADPLVDLTA